MMTIQEYEDEIARLRAEIDNLQAPRPAPTIVEILGPEAFDRMVELYPSFRESGTPTHPTDAAAEVLWSCLRMLGRVKAESLSRLEELTYLQDQTKDDRKDLEEYRKSLAKVAVHYIDEEYPL